MTRKNKAVWAGVAGNVMEWYDFAVYGYFAAVIGQHFFPADDPTVSIIASFGAFAAGFLMRPVGSAIFGHIGDRHGRKAALTLSVLLMAIPTFCIGLLPTHEQIGIAAPVLLVLMRMLQGVSVGGEYTTSIAYLVEQSPPEHRAVSACFCGCGAIIGILLGSGVGALMSSVLSDAEVAAWGWRLPFLAGIAIALAGWTIRRHMDETPPERSNEQRSPLVESITQHWRPLLRIAGLVMSFAVGFYTVFIYAAGWLQSQVHVSRAEALDINTTNMVVLLVMIPVGAWLADRFGRKPVLLFALTGLALGSAPLFGLMHHPDDTMILLGQGGFAVLVGLLSGVVPVTIAELAPDSVRVSVMSLGYNITFGLLGGTAPMVSAFLIKTSHDDLSPSYYLVAMAVISLVVAATMKETRPTPRFG